MNCNRARECFSELLDPRRTAQAQGNGADLEQARAHLASCPDCQREFSALSQTLAALDSLPNPEPSPQLRRSFYAMLEEEKHSAASVHAAVQRTLQRRRTTLFRWVLAPLGAVAFAAIGFVSGLRYAPSAPAPVPATTVVADLDTRRELQSLREKVDRLETMNQLVAATFQQEQRPANERLRTVLTSAVHENPTDRMIDELITSLALDSSANVRLRALEALYAHTDRELVRASVVASLSRESNPLVQVAMIDFLAAARDSEARPTLEKMAVSELTDMHVREAAKRALAQL